MRGLLFEAAQAMLTRVKKWSLLKAWAAAVAKRGGLKKAVVALARRLVVIHRMWIDGREFRWSRESAAKTYSKPERRRDPPPVGRCPSRDDG
jgi:transposase